MTRIRPAAWLMAAVALFLLAVAGYALLVHASPEDSGRRSTRPSTGMAASLCGTSRRSTRWSSGRRSCRSPTRRSPPSCSRRGAVRRSRPGRSGWRCSTIGLLPVVAYLSRDSPGGPPDQGGGGVWIAAVGLWLEPVAMTLFFGQINLVLLALVVGISRCRTASRARASESGWRRGSSSRR